MKHPGRPGASPGGRPRAVGPPDAGDEARNRVEPESEVDAPPPVGGSWERLYTGVILTLVLLILAFWLFTRAYAP